MMEKKLNPSLSFLPPGALHAALPSTLLAALLALALAACQLVPGLPTPTPGPGDGTGEPTTPPSTDVPTGYPPPTTPPPVETPTGYPPPTSPPMPTGSPVPDLQLQRIDMFDPLTGWGLSGNEVLWTGDGGNNWFDVSPVEGTQSQPQAFFLDAASAWAVYPGAGDPEMGRLYRTVDAGRSWTAFEVPFGFAMLFFVNELDGYALEPLGAAAGSEAVDIHRTADGGETWTLVHSIDPEEPEQPGDLPFAGIKTGISFHDPETGWITGFVPMPDFAYLYRTTDGGQTWHHQALPVPAGFEGAFLDMHPPRFFGSESGVLPVRLAAESPATLFFLSADGGETWSPTEPVPIGGLFAVPSATDFIVWGGGPQLYASQDAGRTWDTINPDIDLQDQLAGLEFVDASHGWALSVDAAGAYRLYRTQDGGRTWELLSAS